jgi:hypothetical protein
MFFAELLLFSHKVAIPEYVPALPSLLRTQDDSISCLDERMILKNAFAGDTYGAPIGYKTTNTVYRDSI